MAAADLPDVLLKYEGLNYSIQQTEKAASRTLTTVPVVLANAAAAPFVGIARAIGLMPPAAESKVELKILDDVSGVIRPGTMTLLLSPPGGGKSAFLKALTQRMGHVGDALTGSVSYSGLSVKEIGDKGLHFGQLCQYVDQLDNHMAFLTVRETFTFIAENALANATPAEVHARVDEIIELLHLKNCENTLIGNDLLRGVSGGEKKRVTIGEGIITNARFLALDEISTGLDAAVTYSIVERLRQRALANRLGVVIALLQPTPEVYALFDDIILMRDGAVVYHGPREDLPTYLSAQGFYPPTGVKTVSRVARDVETAKQHSKLASTDSLANTMQEEDDDRNMMDMADWLTELITFPAKTHTKDVASRAVDALADGAASRDSPAGDEPALGMDLTSSGDPSSASADAAALAVPGSSTSKTVGGRKTPPFSTAEMVAAWKQSSQFKALMAKADPATMPSLELTSEFAKQQYGQAYVHHPLVHAKSLLLRQIKLMARNKLFLTFRVMSALLMSVVFGGLFWQGTISDGLNRYGLFLNAAMHVAFANISEMSSACQDKYVGYRHVANGTHPAWTYPLAAILSHFPLAVAESVVFGTVTYFMCGLTYEAGRFFFYLLVILLSDIFASLMFRVFAYSAPTLVAAQAGPMPIIAIMIMFAGFMVTRDKMGWMLFLYYLDPFAYAIKALAHNEFTADRYSYIPPNQPGGKQLTLGLQYLDFFGLEMEPEWKWGSIGVMAGFVVLTALYSFRVFSVVRFDRNIGSARVNSDAAAPATGAAASSKVPSVPSSITLNAGNGTTVSASGGTDTSAMAGSTAVTVMENPLRGTKELSRALSQAKVRSVLPFVPQTVAFKDLRYTVFLPKQLGGGSKVLLQGVTGYALPGRLIALMGASGAGKTTLLDVLAGRKNSGIQTGSVFLNGHPKDERTFNRVAAYCEQMDLHFPLATVREALEFSCELRVPSSVTAEQRHAFVDEVMDILELTPLADRKVGDPGDADGLAPGERKRLTIGVELVSNAPIVFLDEPTSGLDSRAASVVMRVIRNVASTGRTVICTIHQPSSELFNMFDDLLLLQRGGFQVYFGPLGYKAKKLVDYLASLPGVPPCPADYNVATYMLDVLAGTDSSGTGTLAVSPSMDTLDVRVGMDGSATPYTPAVPATPSDGVVAKKGKPALTPMGFQEAYFSCPLWAGEEGAGATVDKLCAPAQGTTPLKFDSPRARSFIQQYIALVRRQSLFHLRNIPFNLGRFGALVGLCLVFGTIYFNLSARATDISGVQSLVAAIFMTSAFSAMLNMDAALPTLIKTRPNYYREQSSLMYDPGAFSLAYATVEVPWLAINVLVATAIAYHMIGLRSVAYIFFYHYLVTLMLACVLVSMGLAVAFAMPSFDVAQAVIGTLAPVLFLFGGMFSPPSSMPPGARWVNVIDPITYAFSSLVVQHFHCEDSSRTAGTCPVIVVPSVQGPISIDRQTFVDARYELNYDGRWNQVGYIAIFILAFQFLAVLAVRYIRHIVR